MGHGKCASFNVFMSVYVELSVKYSRRALDPRLRKEEAFVLNETAPAPSQLRAAPTNGCGI